MWIVDLPDGGRRVEFHPTAPGVYLDHCILGQIAESEPLRTRFLRRLDRGGTVALSYLHSSELARMEPGHTMDERRRLLDAIGPRFILVDPDLDSVGDRLSTGECADEVSASVDHRLASEIAQHRDAVSGPCSAGLLCALAAELHGDVVESFKHEELQAAEWMNFARRARALDRRRAPDPGVTRSERVWSLLFGAATLDSAAVITSNDVMDLLHACVPLAVCEFVVLDRKWAPRAQRVPSPPRLAEVFSGKKDQIERFLDAFERWEPPPGTK